jgi:hypothetical protein
MLSNFYYFVAGCCFLTFVNWRLGPWLMLLVGLVSDPVRKLTPGHPVYISVSFVLVFGVFFLLSRNYFRRNRPVFFYYPSLRPVMRIFGVFLAINAVRPILEDVRYLPLVAYGCAQYVALFLCARIGFNLVDRERAIMKFSRVFLWTLLPFLFTVLLSFWNRDNLPPILQVMTFEGGGFTGGHYYKHFGDGRAPLDMLSGFFRTPEVMGWFAMMVSLISLYLVARLKNKPGSLLFYGTTFAFSATCILLSGRRKFFAGIFVFAFLFIVLTIRRNFRRGFTYLLLFLLAGGLFLYFAAREGSLDTYFETGQTALTEAKDRLDQGGIDSIAWAIRRDGFFGRGIGTTAQGAAHFKTKISARGYIEGGPGKMISELGVHGLVTFLIVIFMYFRNVYRMTIRGRFQGESRITVVFLFAVVLTHAAEFVISHQVYGDPMIAVTTGLSFGFLMATAKLQEGSSPGRVSKDPRLSVRRGMIYS